MRFGRSFVVRGTYALALVLAGYASVSRNLASALAQTDPLAGLAVSSNDARVVALGAQALIDRAKTDSERRAAATVAKSAILRDGTALPAVTTLAMTAGLAGNEKLASSWFDYSNRLSRRDLRTHLFYIEQAVSGGNIGAALRRYDTALRSSEENAPAILFPILRNAIADQAVRHELAKTLVARPVWTDRFISELVTKGPNFESAAQLLSEARQRGMVIDPGIEELLISQLVGQGQGLAAWQYYVLIHPGAEHQPIRNQRFSADRVGNSAFDWQLLVSDGASASLGAQDNHSLEYQTPPAVGATITRQLTALKPGRYRLESVLTAAGQPLRSGPYWEVKCMANGNIIGMVEMGGPVSAPRLFAGDVVVPADCTVQWISLIVRGTDDPQGSTGKIGSISVTRIGS